MVNKMSRKKRLLIYLLASGLTAGFLGLLAILGAYLYYAPTLPDAQELKQIRLQVPLRVFSRDERLLAEYGDQRRVPLTLEQIPDEMELAILAAEDDRFYQHPGIDLMGIARAMWMNIRAGEIVGGASTITQQVAKNFFLSFEQVWSRKIREIFLAFKIEEELSKEEILTLYLNKIFLGNRAYGVGAAAEIYYGKPLDELSLAQMAMIATMPKSPSRNNPIANPERALERRGYVLGRMLELEYIDQAAYDEAMAEPVTAKYHGFVVDLDAPYIAEMARAEAEQRFGDEVYSAGYRIYTSVNGELQEAANAAMETALQEFDQRHGYRGPAGQVEAAELEELLAAQAEWLAENPVPREAIEVGDEQGATTEVVSVNANTEDRPLSPIDELLEDYPEPGSLTRALVTAIDDERAVVWAEATGKLELGLAAMAWARPELENDRLGPAPETPQDVLDVGQIVYLWPDASEANEAGWRLAQEPKVQGALISLDPVDGAIRALTGGYDYYRSKFNRATQAERQPGSSFKPFVYSAALANGFTPATIVNDAPVVFADEQLEDVWRPENDSGRFYGPTRLREALVRSRNLVSIRVMQTIGIVTAIDYLSEIGFPRERLPRDLSLSLGSAAFSPLEMAREYAMLANGGFLVEPYFIDRIEDVDGTLLYLANPPLACPECEQEDGASEQAGDDAIAAVDDDVEVAALEDEALLEPEALQAGDAAAAASEGEAGSEPPAVDPFPEPVFAERVMSPQVNYLITDMMRDVIRRGTGVKARELGREDIAGKTGTTNEYRDAWFSGFNPEVATTVWVGFDDFTSLGRGEYGGRAALPAWIEFMRVALAGREETFRERPTGLVSVRIDPESGLLASATNSAAIFETFIEGSLPEAEQPRDEGLDGDDKKDDTPEADLF
ncbi:MAG: penicillin-binding protein 1A [Gammaproteobacteria bacterium]|nr:penicillin-binding protein 1A [Gammaproteobacteria bacterium]